jgi:hypothetical protein
VEHAPRIQRPFPWLVAAALLLVALGALLLVHWLEGTRPEPGSGPVFKRQATAPARPLRPRSHISVLVLNGNGVANAAGGEATSLLARGYRHAIPTDAQASDYARSLVLFRPGWGPEAERLARDARIATVAPLDGQVSAEYARVPLVLILGAK